MRRRAHRRGGFVLLEALPALLLVLAVLLLALRLLWTGLRAGAAGQLLQAREAAAPEVWRALEAGGGRAAVALRAADGGWQVFDFPDEAWLPESGPTGAAQLWRRRAAAGGSGEYWQFDYRLPAAAGAPARWQGWGRVARGAPPAGEAAP